LGIAFPLGVSVSKWTRIFAERHPTVALEVLRVSPQDQPALLVDGSVDFCFARLPFPSHPFPAGEQHELHIIPLYEENIVAVMHDEHLLTLERTVTMAELSAETVLAGEPDERMLRDVAEGGGLAIIPQSVAKALRRKDVSALRITDAEPNRVALVWLAANPNPFVDEFVGIVRGRTLNSSRGRTNEAAQPQATRESPKPRSRPTPQRKPASRGRRKGRRG
jgi:LysR substrate binding domain